MFLLGLMLLGGGCASTRWGERLDAGPIVTRDRSLDGAQRTRVAGPLYERQVDGQGRTFSALRPLFSDTEDPVRARRLREYLWPLGIVKTLGQEKHWRFLTGYGHDFDRHDPESPNRHMVFPFLFWGRARTGEGYFGVFPLYGDIREVLGRDRFHFVLFPLYGYHNVDDVETWEILWPFISRTKGSAVSRFRVWPLYGRSVDGDKWVKHFALWPIWTHARFDHLNSRGTSWILFPLYGRTAMADQQGWTVLPPLFRWSRAGDERLLYCPWPFIQYRAGSIEQLYLWPLWGQRSRAGSRSGFTLWPLHHWERVESAGDLVARDYLFPFVYHEKRTATADAVTGDSPVVASRYVKLWPLVDYRREAEASRVRLPALWPLKHTGAVERNLAPLWTVFSHSRLGEKVETELLWGLARYRREADVRESYSIFPLMSRSRERIGTEERSRWSVLLGLIGRDSGPEEDVWRLLWFLRY